MSTKNNSGVIFSDRVRTLMRDKGVTQKELSDGIGITQGMVSKWLNGAIPKGDKLAAIAAFFSVTADELLQGHDPLDRLRAAAALANAHPGTKAEKQAKFDRVLEAQESYVTNWRERAELAERKVVLLEKRLEKVHKGLVKLVEQLGESE